jgi:4-hydroxybenzoate polyprenyltransferase
MIRYMKLARVTAWPALALVFLIPFAAGANTETDFRDVLFGFVAIASFASFVFALNLYSDKDTDRYHDGKQKDFNLSRQPLVTGEVTERDCRAFCVVSLISAIIFSFLVSNLFALLIVLACLFGGILYSHPWIRLKAKPLGDILCIASVGVLLPSAGYLLSIGVVPDGLILLYLFLITATIYTASVITDYEFDLKARLKTSAVFFGQGRLVKAMAIGCVLSLPVALMIVVESYPLGTKLFVTLVYVSSIALVMVIRKRLRPPRLHMPILASSPRWVFILPGIVTLSFTGYALFKIFSDSYIPWDPFLIH